MKLIVGLGNPGSEYERTRHNAGFMVLDRLAQRHGMNFDRPRSKFHAAVLEGDIAGRRCVLLKPMTYMNRSGMAVAEALAFYKIEPGDLVVVVDDVALSSGRIRLRPEGTCGGHNGLADVERALGSTGYPRLRMGIDPPGMIPQIDYVLGRFTREQLDALGPAVERACDCIECWISDGLERAMTRFNAKE